MNIKRIIKQNCKDEIGQIATFTVDDSGEQNSPSFKSLSELMEFSLKPFNYVFRCDLIESNPNIFKPKETVDKSKYRYVVNISFIGSYETIAEPVKTLKEAQSYKDMIDESVREACVVDRVNNNIAEWWKKNR